MKVAKDGLLLAEMLEFYTVKVSGANFNKAQSNSHRTFSIHIENYTHRHTDTQHLHVQQNRFAIDGKQTLFKGIRKTTKHTAI